MTNKNSNDLVYVVLHVRQGIHFDGWRKVRLRIAPVLEKQFVVSDYVLAVAEPIFHMYFVWCITEPHLKLLQKLRRKILIGVVAEQAGRTWTTGIAKIGIQDAQLYTSQIALHSQQLPLQLIDAPVETELDPELVVTLAIQSEVPVDKRAQVHVMHLIEPPEAGNILNTTDPTPSTSKDVKRDNSSERKLSEAKQPSLTGSKLKLTPSASKNVKRDNSSEHEPSPKPNERKESRVAETTTKNVRFQDEP